MKVHHVGAYLLTGAVLQCSDSCNVLTYGSNTNLFASAPAGRVLQHAYWPSSPAGRVLLAPLIHEVSRELGQQENSQISLCSIRTSKCCRNHCTAILLPWVNMLLHGVLSSDHGALIPPWSDLLIRWEWSFNSTSTLTSATKSPFWRDVYARFTEHTKFNGRNLCKTELKT